MFSLLANNKTKPTNCIVPGRTVKISLDDVKFFLRFEIDLDQIDRD